MSEDNVLMYQGQSRRKVLSYLYRICTNPDHRDELLNSLSKADDGTSADSFAAIIANWCSTLQQQLELRILGNLESQAGTTRTALGLLFDLEGQTKAIAGIRQKLCDAHEVGNERQVNQLLWNVLSQHFKDKMDQLDSFGGGPGTHQLQVMRRLDRLRRELQDRRGSPYSDRAELAADLQLEIRRTSQSNMPGTVQTILEYLYLLDQDYQMAIDDDAEHTELLSDILGDDPLTMIQFQQCLDQLPEFLYQALSIQYELNDEPVFLREQDFKQHYGFGRETLRKRTARAERALAGCLQQ